MLNFPNPDKTMDNLKNILVCLALVSCLACSSEEADVSEQTQADSSDFGAVQENFVFEPVVIAPGDKAIADKAPEGMVL